MKKHFAVIVIATSLLLTSFGCDLASAYSADDSKEMKAIVSIVEYKVEHELIEKADYQNALTNLTNLVPMDTTFSGSSGTAAEYITQYQNAFEGFQGNSSPTPSSNGSSQTPAEIQAELCALNPDSASCNESNNLAGIIGTGVDTLLFFLGATCAIVVIVGGIRFTVSGGNAAAVTNAKNSILYGVIGLVIATSAYAIVHFVLTRFQPVS